MGPAYSCGPHPAKPVRKVADGALRFIFSAADLTSAGRLTCARLDGCHDDRSANSSIPTAPTFSLSGSREASCGCPRGTAPKRDSRCHLSCDSPCGVNRKHGTERWHFEVRARPSRRLAPPGQRSGTAKRCSDVDYACCASSNSAFSHANCDRRHYATSQ